MPNEQRLHLGCGKVTPKGWLNVDGSWVARAAKSRVLTWGLARAGVIPREDVGGSWDRSIVHRDLRKRLPWSAASFEAVYASHLLEHLYHTEGKRLLGECFRVLRPGGVVRIVVPDLATIVREYGEGRVDPVHGFVTPGDLMNRRLGLRRPSPRKGNAIVRLYHALWDFRTHKWMYDEASLVHHLREAGFTEVSRRACFESRIEGIREIEREDRAGGGSLVVEGVKPS